MLEWKESTVSSVQSRLAAGMEAAQDADKREDLATIRKLRKEHQQQLEAETEHVLE